MVLHVKGIALIAVSVAAVLVVAGVAVILVFRDGGDGAEGEVYYVTLLPSSMKAALAGGQIDGYIAWEPYVSDSIVEGVGEALIWSSEMMPNHPCCVVAVYDDFLSMMQGPELTERFLRAHVEATDWMNAAMADPDGENYSLMMGVAVDFTMREEAAVAEALQHMKFGYEMNNSFVSALETFTDMYLEAGFITEDEITDGGYTDVEDFIDSYVDESYLEGSVGLEPSSTILNPDDPIRLGYLQGDLHQLAQAIALSDEILPGGVTIFEKYGLNVEAAPGAPFSNGGAEMDGFAAGNVDIGYLGSPPAILKHLNAGVDTTIVAQVNTEGSAIVVGADSGIESIADLEGMTIAAPGESSIQFLLLKTLMEQQGFTLKLKV
jgi:NitT/TauT family transport system substrate-binding protein